MSETVLRFGRVQLFMASKRPNHSNYSGILAINPLSLDYMVRVMVINETLRLLCSAANHAKLWLSSKKHRLWTTRIDKSKDRGEKAQKPQRKGYK